MIVVEFAYAFSVLEDDNFANIAGRNLAVDGYPYTPEGQRLMMRDVMSVLRGVENGRCLHWQNT